jgi:heme oxygenase
MENPKHTKDLVNKSLARFIVEELTREKSYLEKRKQKLTIAHVTDVEFNQREYSETIMKLDWNQEMLNKMEIVLEMADRYRDQELPRGYTFNPTLSGLNDPKNR